MDPRQVAHFKSWIWDQTEFVSLLPLHFCLHFTLLLRSQDIKLIHGRCLSEWELKYPQEGKTSGGALKAPAPHRRCDIMLNVAQELIKKASCYAPLFPRTGVLN